MKDLAPAAPLRQIDHHRPGAKLKKMDPGAMYETFADVRYAVRSCLVYTGRAYDPDLCVPRHPNGVVFHLP